MRLVINIDACIARCLEDPEVSGWLGRTPDAPKLEEFARKVIAGTLENRGGLQVIPASMRCLPVRAGEGGPDAPSLEPRRDNFGGCALDGAYVPNGAHLPEGDSIDDYYLWVEDDPSGWEMIGSAELRAGALRFSLPSGAEADMVKAAAERAGEIIASSRRSGMKR